jgi:hypothetical protein
MSRPFSLLGLMGAFGFGSLVASVAWAQCPSGYASAPPPAICVVDLTAGYGPTAQSTGSTGYEFGYLPSDTNKEHPVCGKNRIPVSANLEVSGAATTSYPNARDTMTDSSGKLYKYTKGTTPPDYAYSHGDGVRCACLSDNMNLRSSSSTPPEPVPSPNSTRLGVPLISQKTAGDLDRFLHSTFAEISNFTEGSTTLYGPVAVTTDPIKDPRIFELMNPSSGTATSVCSCPNLNEAAQPIDIINPSDSLQGSKCLPMVDLIPKPGYPNATQQISPRVLALYKGQASFFDAKHRVTGWNEGLSSIPETIRLPVSMESMTSQTLTAIYDRRIWTCSAPYELGGAQKKECTFVRDNHNCGKASTTGTLSAYGEVADTQSPANFDLLANKKLACCLNSHALNADGSVFPSFVKYDCVQTKHLDAAGKLIDFNTLWAGADDVLDGGQMNALALVNAHGQPITGFYTRRGNRCSQFSEFAGTLQRKRIKPFLGNMQQQQVSAGAGEENLGSPYPLPSTASYLALKGALTSRTIPTSLQDMNECPILVRAAMVVDCPTFSATKPFVSVNDPSDPSVVRCPVAASVKIHLRIEQLFEIAGETPLKTFDTRASKDQVPGIDIAEIITSKNGTTCWPGTHREGDVCVY